MARDIEARARCGSRAWRALADPECEYAGRHRDRFRKSRSTGGRCAVGGRRCFFEVSQRDQIVALAARRRIPAIYDRREGAAAGGLTTYGADVADANRQVGVHTGRILNGEKPGDLPVQQLTVAATAVRANNGLSVVARTKKGRPSELHPVTLIKLQRELPRPLSSAAATRQAGRRPPALDRECLRPQLGRGRPPSEFHAHRMLPKSARRCTMSVRGHIPSQLHQ
jgi:hypothetical protein